MERIGKLITGIAALSLMLIAVPAFAQDAVDIQTIREQLRQARDQQQAGTTKPLQKETKNELEAANEQLKAAEAELMQKLQTEEKANLKISDTQSSKDKTSVAGSVPPAPSKAPAGARASVKRGAAMNKRSGDKARLSNDFQDLESRLGALKSKYENQNTDLSQIKAKNVSLKLEASESAGQVKKLKQKLEAANNRLLVAETEVERLSAILEEHSTSAKKLGAQSTTRTAKRIPAGVENNASRSRVKQVDDMPIATVVVKKANIRTGPGKNHSPLMTVASGTRLAVEMRQGEWYRVIAPTGVRAWVSASVIAFGEDKESSPTASVSIKGFSQSVENAKH